MQEPSQSCLGPAASSLSPASGAEPPAEDRLIELSVSWALAFLPSMRNRLRDCRLCHGDTQSHPQSWWTLPTTGHPAWDFRLLWSVIFSTRWSFEKLPMLVTKQNIITTQELVRVWKPQGFYRIPCNRARRSVNSHMERPNVRWKWSNSPLAWPHRSCSPRFYSLMAVIFLNYQQEGKKLAKFSVLVSVFVRKVAS